VTSDKGDVKGIDVRWLEANRAEVLKALGACACAPEGYERLAEVLDAALHQASGGKGKERHANDEPFHEQQIVTYGKWLHSTDFQVGQACKKAIESKRLPRERAINELLGAAVIVLEEGYSLAGDPPGHYGDLLTQSVVPASVAEKAKKWLQEHRADVKQVFAAGGFVAPIVPKTIHTEDTVVGLTGVPFVKGDGVWAEVSKAFEEGHAEEPKVVYQGLDDEALAKADAATIEKLQLDPHPGDSKIPRCPIAGCPKSVTYTYVPTGPQSARRVDDPTCSDHAGGAS
jgi:hypothetical protein